MKSKGNRGTDIRKISLACVLILAFSLPILGCGEVDSAENMNPWGGGTNSLMLSWSAPSTNEDGTPLTDLAGYKLYYGSLPGQYSQVITVGDYTTAEIGGLGTGTYYLAVTAYDINGNESRFSNEIQHTFF